MIVNQLIQVRNRYIFFKKINKQLLINHLNLCNLIIRKILVPLFIYSLGWSLNKEDDE